EVKSRIDEVVTSDPPPPPGAAAIPLSSAPPTSAPPPPISFPADSTWSPSMAWRYSRAAVLSLPLQLLGLLLTLPMFIAVQTGSDANSTPFLVPMPFRLILIFGGPVLLLMGAGAGVSGLVAVRNGLGRIRGATLAACGTMFIPFMLLCGVCTFL